MMDSRGVVFTGRVTRARAREFGGPVVGGDPPQGWDHAIVYRRRRTVRPFRAGRAGMSIHVVPCICE
jgi:hypothetical protein